MKIASLTGVGYVGKTRKNIANSSSRKMPVNEVKNNILIPSSVAAYITFGGRLHKNVGQVASIAPEYQGILNSVYKKGGLGNVAGEAAVAFSDKGNLDIRTFVPYYSGDNHEGGVRVLAITDPDIDGVMQEIKNNKTPKDLEGKIKLKTEKPDYALKNGETFIIQQAIDENVPLIKQYAEIVPTSVKGAVSVIDDNLTEVIAPYHMFQVKDTGVGVMGKPPTYIIHTPEVAKFGASYNSAGAYAQSLHADALYTRFTKAAVDAIEHMDSKEFEGYVPGNFWLHDRQSFPALLEIAEKSAQGDDYWRGVKIHSTFHNIGRGYQGHYSTPIDFIQIAGSSKDLQELGKNPDDLKFLRRMSQKLKRERSNGSGKFKPEEIFTQKELDRMNAIVKPLYGNFLDDTGQFNMCEIPVAGAKINPYNCTVGTVSRHYAREMKNPNSQEVASGISKSLGTIPTVDIVNGSSAVNLKLDTRDKIGFGTGFASKEVMDGYTPFNKEVVKDADKFFDLKQKNKKWFIDRMATILSQDEESAKAALFSKADIQRGASVLGNLSPYKEGDVLFIGWGRPDSQKGFPTTFEGILDYFKNPNIEADYKEHSKFLIGAGPWATDAPDWKKIEEQMKTIRELEDGKYKDNVLYLNGFFSNKIVACADYSLVTSRFEPCGITPLESFAGGTPVISNNTGGSPDFIIPFKNASGEKVIAQNGFLTKHAFLSNPETIGLDPYIKNERLDEGRIKSIGAEVSECISNAVKLFKTNIEGYKKMMMNAVGEKIDWHENAKYNDGICAMDCYRKFAWGIDTKNMEISGFERTVDPLQSLKGTVQKITGVNKKMLAAASAAVAGISFLGIAYSKLRANSKDNSDKETKANASIPKQVAPSVLKDVSMNRFMKNA